MVVTGVSWIICSEYRATVGLTALSPNDAARRIGDNTERTAPRPRCTRFGRISGGEPRGLQRRIFQDLTQRRRGNALRPLRKSCAAPTMPVPYRLRELPGVRQHRHAAHRMADQHTGRAGPSPCSTVSRSLTELGDGVGARVRRVAGPAVPALVVEHHPDLVTPLLGEPRALKVERAHAQTEAVGEHDGQRRIGGPDLPTARSTPSGVVTT